MVDVIIYSPEKVLFQGKAKSIIFPGERGVFEVLPYHKPFVSRLLGGKILIDEKPIAIRCGLVGIRSNKATAIVEEP